MAETRSRFIKTVTFGGYDRTDVDKRLEFLYTQVYDLKNELRESKLTLDKLRKGTDGEKAHEYALAVERAKLTELQVKNEASTERIKRAEEENRAKDKEIAALREELKKVRADLENANSELSAMRAGGDAAALGAVFVEAQKSRDMLLETAETQAQKLKTDSEKLAENIIADADNKAALIIHDAEKRAAEINAEALTKSEQMKVASNNMRATMLEDIGKIGNQIGMLKKAVEDFEQEGLRMIEASEKMIGDTEEELKKGGVPVFTAPGEIKPEYPEEPELKPVDFSAPEEAAPAEKEKKNSGLDKLQAMAEAIGGEKKKSGVNLADLAKQAEALDGSGKKNEPKDNKKSGGVNLADLAKQAQALSGDNGKKSGNNAGKTDAPKKGVNLADLAKQAEALNKGKK